MFLKFVLFPFFLISLAIAQQILPMTNDEIEMIKNIMGSIEQNLIMVEANCCAIDHENFDQFKKAVPKMFEKINQKIMIENETPKFADFQEFFAEIYAFLDKVHIEMEIFVKNLSPYCEQNEQKALTRFEMAMQMEKEFLMDNLVTIEEPNAKIKRFFEKFDSSLFAKLTLTIVDMLTMDSLLKDERNRHFSKLFGNSNEVEKHFSAQRRFVRSPPKFGDAMKGVKEVACCWMPKKKGANVFFVNNALDNCSKKCCLSCGCVVMSPWMLFVAIIGTPIGIVCEGANAVRRCANPTPKEMPSKIASKTSGTSKTTSKTASKTNSKNGEKKKNN